MSSLPTAKYDYHIFTDLDFWDARRILKDLALVKRNFGEQPPGDEFPTQIVGSDLYIQLTWCVLD